MKVILLEDVKSLGRKGEVVNASDGYARNMLLPKKLAVAATDSNMKDLAAKKRGEEKLAKEQKEAAEALKANLEAKPVTVSIRVGESGKTFGSVSSKELAEAVKEQLGIEVDRKKMNLAQPIRELGTTTVEIRLHPQVSASLRVNVTEA
ncbi:50S ribosomal protein L9 [Chordicoccus furentiruminis]|jgi:large subunit ribosomal protein L9|uniref:50S ribosomal protein L9 n=1 Tax=Chordicoccus furentiruminis TaxID=2709410 RepID=UPI0023A83612|nr:50S ribosomal protein L9 [Chordicoccus furentiruminis]